MTKFKRSKSIDFTFPVMSGNFSQELTYRPLKRFKSCPNIELEAIQMNDRSEDNEWMIQIKSMIDSWVQKKSNEIQKTELQVLCLEDLQSHYSQQLDMVITKNRSLINELRSAMKKSKSVELEINDKKELQKRLNDQLESSRSLYNDLQLKQNILFQSIGESSDNNESAVDEQKILQERNNLYYSKKKLLLKLLDKNTKLSSEKTALQNTLKSKQISWERDLKKLMDNKVVLEAELKNTLLTYTSVNDKMKNIQETIKKVIILQYDKIEERKHIMEDIVYVENTIHEKSQIKYILMEKFKTLLYKILPFKI